MKKILIIDDMAIMRSRLGQLLRKAGYSIGGEAEDGKEGVSMYKEISPDLVTLDISMPEQNGIETLKQILEYDENGKILIVSAVGQKQMILQALECGAKSFISKPFTEEDFMEEVKKILEN